MLHRHAVLSLALALVLASSLAGCPTSPTSTACMGDDDCPTGQHCRDGLCDLVCREDGDCPSPRRCSAAGRCELGDAGTSEGGTGDVGTDVCRNALDCDDGLYCTGAEACTTPGASGADVRGCVAGTPPCLTGATCDEDSDACVTSCDEDADGNGRLDSDNDGDGHRSIACGSAGAIPGDDCDDADADRYPRTLAEICDPLAPDHDEDCNPCTVASYVADDGDRDGDGTYDVACANALDEGTDPATFECPITVRGLVAVDRERGVVSGTDCDDTPGSGAGIYPTQAELCNGVDDNCDGRIDELVSETVYVDCDGDGWGETGEGVLGCHAGPLPSSSGCSAGGQYVRARMLAMGGETVFDCDGANAAVNPMAADGCPVDDGVDNDCDGRIDEAGSETVYPDCDLDSWPRGTNSRAGCHGNVLSAADRAALSCGPGSRWLRAGSQVDCDDTRGTVYPTAPESCNGINDDCDAATDEGTRSSLYRDADGDGYGAGSVVSVCTGTAGYVSNNTDCNDGNATIHPGQTEICDRAAVDHNCSGTNDEGLVPRCYDADNDTHGVGPAVYVCPTESGWINNCGGDCDETSSYRTSRWVNVTAAPDLDSDRYCDSGLTTYCVGAGGPVYTGGWLGVPVRTDCIAYADCAPFNALVGDSCSYLTITGTGGTRPGGAHGCGWPNVCSWSETMTCPAGWRPSDDPGYDRCFCYRTLGGGTCTPSVASTDPLPGRSRRCNVTQAPVCCDSYDIQPQILCEPCGNAACTF